MGSQHHARGWQHSLHPGREQADWDKHGDAKNDYELWEDMTYGTAGYVGEGILAFDLHCGQPHWRAWIEKAVQPNIEFLLKTQLPDGTWSKLPQTSWDRTRCPGVIDYLIWYYGHVNPDPARCPGGATL